MWVHPFLNPSPACLAAPPPHPADPRSRVGTQLPLAPGGLLQDVDWAAGCLYVLLDGHLLAERPAGGAAGGEDGAPPGGGGGGPGPVVQESALISPGRPNGCGGGAEAGGGVAVVGVPILRSGARLPRLAEGRKPACLLAPWQGELASRLKVCRLVCDTSLS